MNYEFKTDNIEFGFYADTFVPPKWGKLWVWRRADARDSWKDVSLHIMTREEEATSLRELLEYHVVEQSQKLIYFWQNLFKAD